jgi:DNA-binding CsgD family transcriptional regulator
MVKNKSLYAYLLRHAKKLRIVEQKGGGCEHCGEKRIWLLAFHHQNPKEQHLKYSDLKSGRFTEYQEESKKCRLLCHNCHTKVHAELHPEKVTKYTLAKIVMLKYKKTDCCQKCGYKENNKCLHFHHIDKKEKDFNFHVVICKQTDDIETTVKDELDKCVVLCANCHKNEHFDLEKYTKYLNEILSLKDTHQEKRKALPVLDILNLYANNKTVTEIAKIYKVNKSTIGTILRKNQKGESMEEKSKRKMEKIENIKKLLEQKKTKEEIAEILNTPLNSIRSYIVQYKLKL